jgi:hypothetical protein
MENEDAPEDINIHKRIWGENADQVVYDRVGGKEGENNHFEEERCPFCDSRIDEFGYFSCCGASG